MDAPGALEVIAEAGGRRIVRHRVLGASYVSSGDPRFHLGLGPVSEVDHLTVVWPDGSESVETAVAVDRVLRVEPPEGQ